MNANNTPTALAEAPFENCCNTAQQMVDDALASTSSPLEASRYIEETYAGYPQGHISDAHDILAHSL